MKTNNDLKTTGPIEEVGAPRVGEVAAIYVAPKSGADMTPTDAVNAVAGRGFEGDRYFEKLGKYSDIPEPGRQVTLVEIEAIEAVQREHGIAITPGDARRNVVTRGVSLNDLVGKEFRVGDATLVGVELCEPCAHLVSLIGDKKVLRALVHRGGIRADIVSSGPIQVGDPVVPPAEDERAGLR
jgi:MOSC domain-containing protein YiiM